ncbi:hypothetical protein SADO_07282 [Salinisphaera dokdonensis CL-ES53]|uniref:Uncharacterized protein n=1 Tax=Salinisphaera dokdonensis CL-ES53 TaxID=1304272 RepID=A0ABV2AZG9_9GAMM
MAGKAHGEPGLLMLLASLSCGIGAGLIYFAHPNQTARTRPLTPAVGGLGGLFCLVGLGLWIAEHGALVGLTIALTLWMLVFTLLPYLAAWLGKHPSPLRRPGQRGHSRPHG